MGFNRRDKGPGSGTQGPRGPQGIDGVQGPQGPAGEQGPHGPQGIPGPQGEIGAQGQIGATGGPGATGPRGAKGAKGITGNTGNAGADGQDGTDGQHGAAGAQGPRGLQGIQGDQGAQGPPGTHGQDGADGQDGPPGPAGTLHGTVETLTINDKAKLPITLTDSEALQTKAAIGDFNLKTRSTTTYHGQTIPNDETFETLEITGPHGPLARFGKMEPGLNRNAALNGDVDPNNDQAQFDDIELHADTGIVNGNLHLHNTVKPQGAAAHVIASIRAIAKNAAATYKNNILETRSYIEMIFGGQDGRGNFKLQANDGNSLKEVITIDQAILELKRIGKQEYITADINLRGHSKLTIDFESKAQWYIIEIDQNVAITFENITKGRPLLLFIRNVATAASTPSFPNTRTGDNIARGIRQNTTTHYEIFSLGTTTADILAAEDPF